MTSNQKIRSILKDRIMVLDGAMGSMLQGYKLKEDDFRGERFKDHHLPLQGNNDLLSITRPDVVQEIHEAYYEAGADFATTNSFSGTTIAQADYELESAVYEINFQSAQCARKAADKYTELTPDQPRFVVGGMGPTNRTASISPDVNDPGMRLVTFDDLRIAYYDQAKGLLDGGADVLMVETVFDTLNCKAAIMAIKELEEDIKTDIPIMVSGTITDASGRTLTGQTVEAFHASVRHGDLLSVGLNCALGANEMYPYINRLSKISSFAISAHPNAGLPNEFGQYDETAAVMAPQVEEFIKNGHVNIIGGCCGTTPDHITAFKKLADQYKPRQAQSLV
ncbi:homocysteine S-methyltransferase family protein [Lentisphaera marina]|uniref:homocysteine S-methyltransferase family protein n=1 Tax=Lentisphaera marina TaxID=1111041 RepID=UPI0023671802|nr:homocysteine S-methyltransferase family protein [Lentisphaera marina]MDD7983824.1 homocysteine S-methyltransferase family protein [Lentisphaera marina]